MPLLVLVIGNDMVKDTASRGYERGSESYRSARPAYHPTIIDVVVRRTTGAPVVELGAGTGILTAELLAKGSDVLAVEPVEAMRRVLIKAVGEGRVCDGTAEHVPVEANTAGAVIAAQAFHWFDAQAALDEISRVLRPGGQLLTVWNVRDESVPWVAAWTEVVDRYGGVTPRYRTMDWRRAIEADGRFALDDERSVSNPQPSSPERVVDRALSTSFIAALSDEEQTVVADQIRRVVDSLGDAFDYPYRSEFQAWVLRG